MDDWRANIQNPILDSQPLVNPNENAKSTLISIVGFSLFTIILGSVWGTLSTNGETVAYSCFQKIFYVAWTAKFYPQLYMNFKRKTSTGLSLDSLYFSLVGYSCFAIYSACTFYEVQVFGQVANHNTSLAIFELLLLFHAAIASAILVAQKYYYDGYYLSTHRGRNSLSRTTNFILTCYFSLNTLYLTLVGIHISVKAITVSFNEWIISLVYAAVIFVALRWVPQFFKIRYDKSFKGLSLSSVVLEDIGAFALLVSVAVSSNGADASLNSQTDAVLSGLARDAILSTLAAFALFSCNMLLFQYFNYTYPVGGGTGTDAGQVSLDTFGVNSDDDAWRAQMRAEASYEAPVATTPSAPQQHHQQQQQQQQEQVVEPTHPIMRRYQ